MPAGASGPRLNPVRFGATLAVVTAPVVLLLAVLLNLDNGSFADILERGVAVTIAVAVLAFAIGVGLVWQLNRRN